MKENIMPFKWEEELNKADKVFSIGNDFMLIDMPVILSVFDYPFKMSVSTTVICTKGSTQGYIDMKYYNQQAPFVCVLQNGQILQYEHISNDFEGFFLVMSERFGANLLSNMHEHLSLSYSFANNPYVSLTDEETASMLEYYELLKRTARIEDLSVRREIAKHLTLAFYYALGYQSNVNARASANNAHLQRSVLLDRFLNHVQTHFREQRDIGFYAEKMNLTPKYLSKIIKENSGASAGEWIDNYVILEAKALLKSTDKTIQQIAGDLNFPSQSFFGKYFKRLTGKSPKEYRRKM